MGCYSHTTICETPPDMTWLIGRAVRSVKEIDYSWLFVFDDGSSIATESPGDLSRPKGLLSHRRMTGTRSGCQPP